MSEKYEIVKQHYDDEFWSKEKVKRAVVKHWITEEEYLLITGEEYD